LEDIVGAETRNTDEAAGVVRSERVVGVFCAILVVLLFSSFTLVSRLGLSASSLAVPDLVPLHRGFDRLSVSRIERGQVGAGHLDGDAPSGAGLA